MTRILARAKGVSASLKDHLIKGDIKCVPHLRAFLTGNPGLACEFADYIRGHFGAHDALDATDRVALVISECETQGREDALEMKWAAGRADSVERAALLAAIEQHREELRVMAESLLAEQYAPICRPVARAGVSL